MFPQWLIWLLPFGFGIFIGFYLGRSGSSYQTGKKDGYKERLRMETLDSSPLEHSYSVDVDGRARAELEREITVPGDSHRPSSWVIPLTLFVLFFVIFAIVLL